MSRTRLIAELQSIWKGIAPDALEAADGEDADAEYVRDIIYTQVWGTADTQLSPESARLWKAAESDPNEIDKILQEAFPYGETYGY